MDEVDSIAGGNRGDAGAAGQIAASSINTLLQLMDGVNKKNNVVVIAATNYPQNLDPAFLRRFLYQIPIDLPTVDDVFKMLNLLISKHIKKFRTITSIQNTRDITCKGQKKVTVDDCVRKLNSTGCGAQIEIDPLGWKNDKVAGAMISEVLTKEQLNGFAGTCVSKKFSGSDVARLFTSVTKRAARMALTSGKFLKTQTTGGVEVAYSLNCMDVATRMGVVTDKSSLITMHTAKSGMGYDFVDINGVKYQNIRDDFSFQIPMRSDCDAMYIFHDYSNQKVSFLFQYNATIIPSFVADTSVASTTPQDDISDTLSSSNAVSNALKEAFESKGATAKIPMITFLSTKTYEYANNGSWGSTLWNWLRGAYTITGLEKGKTENTDLLLGYVHVPPTEDDPDAHNFEFFAPHFYVDDVLKAFIGEHVFQIEDDVTREEICTNYLHTIQEAYNTKKGGPIGSNDTDNFRDKRFELKKSDFITTIKEVVVPVGNQLDTTLPNVGVTPTSATVSPSVAPVARTCEEMEKENLIFVNWDFSPIHFMRALEYDVKSSYNPKDYSKFDKWRKGDTTA